MERAIFLALSVTALIQPRSQLQEAGTARNGEYARSVSHFGRRQSLNTAVQPAISAGRELYSRRIQEI